MNVMTIQLDQLLECGQVDADEVADYLVTHFYSGVRHLAHTILHNADEAEDVAQRTIIQATNKIKQYQPHTNLRAWVYRIGVNEARMLYRRRQAHQKLWQLLTLNWHKPILPSPEVATLQDERDERLWQAVSQLAEKQRLVVVLRYSEGLATADIATVLAIPSATVRSRLHYAHKQLRTLLAAPEVTP